MRNMVLHPDSLTVLLRRRLCPQPPRLTLAHHPVAHTLKGDARRLCPNRGLPLLSESYRRSLESSHFRLTLFTDGLPASWLPQDPLHTAVASGWTPPSLRLALILLFLTRTNPGLPSHSVHALQWLQSKCHCLSMLSYTYKLEMIVPTSEIMSKCELPRPTLFLYLPACLSVLGLVINELIHFGKHEFF